MTENKISTKSEIEALRDALDSCGWWIEAPAFEYDQNSELYFKARHDRERLTVAKGALSQLETRLEGISTEYIPNHTILEEWQVIDRWWTDSPINREYIEVLWDDRKIVFVRTVPDEVWRIWKSGKT